MGVWSKAFIEVCKPVSKMTGSEWADAKRVIGLGTSAEPGPWRTWRTPYLKEIMDAATDKMTERVVLMCASQIGKSECLLNTIGYFADQEPSPQLMLQPTVEAAQAFSKERIEKMFSESPGLIDKLEKGKDGRGSEKKSSTTILMKHYPGGFLALVGANSPSGLASRPIRVLLLDEVDRYPPTAGKEGPPVKLAVQRTRNFANRKIVMVSTPTIAGISVIYDEFLKGDQRHFLIPCPECGHEHDFKWESVKWQKDADGKGIPKTAALYCPECGCKIRGHEKVSSEMLETGHWVASNPGVETRSYHLNALYSPWVNLSDLVQEWIDAKESGDPEQLKTFINLQLGEPWEEYQAEAEFWETLYRRREFYPTDTLPEGVLVLTAGVDVQRDRLECSIYGWGKGCECWAIKHVVIVGSPSSVETWNQLDYVLFSKYTLANKSTVSISCACVDSGDGENTTDVYRYTKPRTSNRIVAIKGKGGLGVPFINPPSKNNLLKAPLYSLGVDAGKSKLMARLHIEEPGPGYVHFNMTPEAGFTAGFFQQLTAEVLKTVFEGGRQKSEWKKIRKRNEALDCAVYATAALELLNPNFEYLSDYYKNGGSQSQTKRSKRLGVVSKGVQV